MSRAGSRGVARRRRDLHARGNQTARERRTGLARPDNDRIVGFAHQMRFRNSLNRIPTIRDRLRSIMTGL